VKMECAITRFCAAALTALLAVPAAGQLIQINIGARTARIAVRLTQEVELVQRSFDRGRRDLPTVPGPGGVPEHPRAAVAALIDDTEADLEQAMVRVDPDLAALDAWAKEEIRKVRAELGAAPPAVAARLHPLPWRNTIAFAATKPKPKPQPPAPPAPQPDTLAVARSNELLDRVENVIGKIFFLASHDDLEVKLWVGSTPTSEATFRCWPQSGIKGSAPAAVTLRANGKRAKVLRGLYAYKAAWTKGAVTEVLEYPPSPGTSAASMPSDRLDLVNGSNNFCCRFGEKYCSHVDDEKDCRLAKR
jgi:hypothetical protein